MRPMALCLLLAGLAASCASTKPQYVKEASFSFKELQDSASPGIGEPLMVKSTDGVSLACYPYLARKPIASLVFVHGGGAYSGAGY